jgi:hypothetical protein
MFGLKVVYFEFNEFKEFIFTHGHHLLDFTVNTQVSAV